MTQTHDEDTPHDLPLPNGALLVDAPIHPGCGWMALVLAALIVAFFLFTLHYETVVYG